MKKKNRHGESMSENHRKRVDIIRIKTLLGTLLSGFCVMAFAADLVVVVDPWPVVGSESESLEIGFYAEGPCPDAAEPAGLFSIDVSLVGSDVAGGPPAVQKIYSITLKRGEYEGIQVPFVDFGAGKSVPVTVTFERPPGTASCGATFSAGTFDTSTGETRSSGIRWFNTTKGYGFIAPDNGSSAAGKQGLQDVFLNHVRKTRIGAVGEALETSFVATCRGDSDEDESTSLVPMDERFITIKADFYDPYGLIAPQSKEVVLHDGELATVAVNFSDFGAGPRVPILSQITVSERSGPCYVTSSERTYDASTGETLGLYQCRLVGGQLPPGLTLSGCAT